MIVETVIQLRPSNQPMFVGVLLFSKHFFISNFTSMEMAFLFIEALPSKVQLKLGGHNEGQKVLKKITQMKESKCSTIQYDVQLVNVNKAVNDGTRLS